MKRIFTIIFFCLSLLMIISGCHSKMKSDIADLQQRVKALEDLTSRMNKDVESIQTIASAVQNGNYITSVTPISYVGETAGYTIAFAKGDPITIYNGKNGTNGTDGHNGEDGHTPIVGVKAATDGILYWTLDNDWLLDANGQKIKAVGADGKDGNDGNDGLNGEDGITPQLKIEDDYWYVSTDKGATWIKLSKAKGEDGQDGTGGDSMFAHIDYSTNGDYVIFSLSNGVNLQVPTWSAYERLNNLCIQMNSNFEGIGTILDAIDQSYFISTYSTLVEDGKEIGYVITFSSGEKIIIYNGQDGEDGHTPQVGVKQDSDGMWYWTLDGEWLLNTDNEKIKAVGADGADGVTPQLKIENGYWYVSMDKGENWTQYGMATGEDGVDGDSFFKSVTQDENNVYFTLSDDTTITIPKSSVLEITFDPDGEVFLQEGVKTDITYTVTSSLTPVTVRVVTSSDIKAKVTPADSDGLTGTISLEAISKIDEYSHIEVMIDNGAKMTMANLTPVSFTPAWVDLGLPSGVKWATCNVGAASPEEYGDYYAWGETEPKSEYNWATYSFCKGTQSTLTKYNTSSTYGTVDNKSTLELTDDAANSKWGGSWRMPTNDDWTELRTKCTWAWTSQNNVKGYLVTGPNGSGIFLPASGLIDGTSSQDVGSKGYYWSVNLHTSYPYAARCIHFYSTGTVFTSFTHRYIGLQVRPVLKGSL